MFTRFHTIHERDGLADGLTTPRDGRRRAIHHVPQKVVVVVHQTHDDNFVNS